MKFTVLNLQDYNMFQRLKRRFRVCAAPLVVVACSFRKPINVTINANGIITVKNSPRPCRALDDNSRLAIRCVLATNVYEFITAPLRRRSSICIACPALNSETWQVSIERSSISNESSDSFLRCPIEREAVVVALKTFGMKTESPLIISYHGGLSVSGCCGKEFGSRLSHVKSQLERSWKRTKFKFKSFEADSLRRGAGVNVQDSNGYTPLHHACLRGHKEIARLLLAADASPCLVDSKGASPLHLAAWVGATDIVRMLLAHNTQPANVDLLTNDHETALLYAAQFGHVEVVALLLGYGADVTVRNNREESALDLAAQYGKPARALATNSVQYSNARGREKERYTKVESRREKESESVDFVSQLLKIVRHLLSARPQLVDPYRAPVSRRHTFSHTPLHRASINGHSHCRVIHAIGGVITNAPPPRAVIVSYSCASLRYNARIGFARARDPRPRRARAAAGRINGGWRGVRSRYASNFRASVVEFLWFNSGACFRYVPISQCIKLSKAMLLTVTLCQRANESLRFIKHTNALPYATFKYLQNVHFERINCLFVAQKTLTTYFILNVWEWREIIRDVVAALLDAGVDPNLLTPNGTALHEAALCGKESVVSLLIQRGVRLNAKDKDGRTVAMLLSEFPEKATQRVREVILRSGPSSSRYYESEDDLPAIPVQDQSPYENSSNAMRPIRRSPSELSERRVSNPSMDDTQLSNRSYFDLTNSMKSVSSVNNPALHKIVIPPPIKQLNNEIKNLFKDRAMPSIQAKCFDNSVLQAKELMTPKSKQNHDINHVPIKVLIHNNNFNNANSMTMDVPELSSINDTNPNESVMSQICFENSSNPLVVRSTKPTQCINGNIEIKQDEFVSSKVNNIDQMPSLQVSKSNTENNLATCPSLQSKCYNFINNTDVRILNTSVTSNCKYHSEDYQNSEATSAQLINDSDVSVSLSLFSHPDKVQIHERKSIKSKNGKSGESLRNKIGIFENHFNQTDQIDGSISSEANFPSMRPKIIPNFKSEINNPIYVNELKYLNCELDSATYDSLKRVINSNTYSKDDMADVNTCELKSTDGVSNIHESESDKFQILLTKSLHMLSNLCKDLQSNKLANKTEHDPEKISEINAIKLSISELNNRIKHVFPQTFCSEGFPESAFFEEKVDIENAGQKLENCISNIPTRKFPPSVLPKPAPKPFQTLAGTNAILKNLHDADLEEDSRFKNQETLNAEKVLLDDNTVDFFDKTGNTLSADTIRDEQNIEKNTIHEAQDKKRKARETQKNTKLFDNKSTANTSLTKIHPQSFVKKLASKCLGLKAKFNSAPNISNSGLESEVALKSKCNEQSNNNSTLLIGNSKFFKKLSKKNETGDMVCNDEFDTISLDRLGTLERESVANRSNRSCPGFKVSLPNIAENTELGGSRESLNSVIIVELDDISEIGVKNDLTEAINKETINDIFEPRNSFGKMSESPKVPFGDSIHALNECYESYEFTKPSTNEVSKSNKPLPQPRRNLKQPNSINSILLYENVILDNNVVKPKPVARKKKNSFEDESIYENLSPTSVEEIKPKVKPQPPKRNFFPIQIKNNLMDDTRTLNLSSSNTSISTTPSSDSLADETNLEDVLLSMKSNSFKHTKKIRSLPLSDTSVLNKSDSILSNSSDVTEISAMENIDCSEETDNNMIYNSMTGTLPNRKSMSFEKSKVLFRHKTFTNTNADRNLTKIRDSLKWNNDFLTETLKSYHIRGTGHCIYQGPTVKEFLHVFNRDNLYHKNRSFNKYLKRDSYYETAICFCKPMPSKHHNSAEDLLKMPSQSDDAEVTIDIHALSQMVEMSNASFRCFCDDNLTCVFHTKKRESPNPLVIKFSAINKSISAPNISLQQINTSSTKSKKLIKNKSFPKTENPYAIVDVTEIVARKANYKPPSEEVNGPFTSLTSTLSSTTDRTYSIKDVAEVISLTDRCSAPTDDASPTSAFCDNSMPSMQKTPTSSGFPFHWQSGTNSSNGSKSEYNSFKSCFDESDSDNGTLHSDGDSSSDDGTLRSDVSATKRPWVDSDSFKFDNETASLPRDTIDEEQSDGSPSECESPKGAASEEVGVGSSLVASLERARGAAGAVRSGSGRRRWDELEVTSEGDALSLSSAASSNAPHHMAHHYELSKVSVSLDLLLVTY
ncbi:Ankyrin repeat and SAM domain-containing protein 1A [Eumeta japonica]|uniref:Ankyrin repeat and SAM domain-containing protein 1A n=1 Tax=Eumeta variegata TaxID=151549 RepID=A0A4C1X0V6_EUMVA|nr:Ankyrin repeat and SAM domain-containing protein 1A [Eumeta japonica]